MLRTCLVAALLLTAQFVSLAGSPEAGNKTAHWSFQPVRLPTVPSETSGWAKNPIDAFVLEQLRRHQLTPNKPVERSALIRRAFFDLIGLPPTPEDAAAFVADRSPDAFARLVDRLLASDHYGERWGRHWLDLARYADTSGDGADDPIPEAHLYRDYVIDAFNQDLPYDEFIIEQIAGDLLAKADPSRRRRERIIATGYVALARRFNNSPYSDMHLVIENNLSTIGKGMLGLTLGCARCHDHKFDPISTRDYYGLYGYFAGTQYPHAGTEHERHRKNFVPLPGGGLAYAVMDKTNLSEIRDARIQIKGNPANPGEVARRGFLRALDPHDASIPAGESGRFELARWIASTNNPLTARVMVNRIWQFHFGQGLVASSSDFGKQGAQPSHPELLDWLASEFMRSGWSIKQLHRLIMLSATYQLSADASDENVRIDPGDQWHWRYPRHRLEAEPMRDAILFVSGRLREGNPGAPPFPKPNAKGEYPYTQHTPFLQDYDHEFRTVYLPSRRLGKHPYLESFNGADPNECTANREASTVPLQALFWMNSKFVRDNSRAAAERLIRLRQDAGQRIDLAYLLAFSRPPKAQEKAEALKYFGDYGKNLAGNVGSSEREQRAWTSFCRVLFASNEFIYLD